MIEISTEKLTEPDDLYDHNPSRCRGVLVKELRKIRSIVEAGDVVQIAGGPTLNTSLEFHTSAYRRYRLLKEGWDAWIGDDD